MRSRSTALLCAVIVGLGLFAYFARRTGGAGANGMPAPAEQRGLETLSRGSTPLDAGEAAALPLPDSSAPTPRAEAQGTPPPPSPEEALEADARIDGLVLRPDGKPAALARVQFVELGAGGWPNDQREDSTVSDDAGRFTIHPAPIGRLQLVAMHEEWAPSGALVLEIAAGERKREQRLLLRRPGRIDGLVRDAQGNPRAGASITCTDWMTQKALFAESDAAGRFVLEKVAPAQYDLSVGAGAEELALLRSETLFLANMLERACNSAHVEVGEGQTVEVVLGGIPAGSVRLFGRVRAGEAAQAGVWLWAEASEDDDYANIPHARTDERGEYQMRVGGGRAYRIHLQCLRGALDLERGVRITEREAQRVDFDLPAGRIGGRVIDRAGRALAGQMVQLQFDSEPKPDDAGFVSSYPQTRTDSDGRFVFEHLVAGHVVLRVRPDEPGDEQGTGEHGFASVALDLAAGQQLDGIEIVLSPGCVVRGQLRAASTGPLPIARIAAFDESGSVVLGCRSEPDGSFVLRGLPEGRFAFDASGGGWVAPVSELVALRADHESSLELTLQPGVQPRVIVHPAGGTQPRTVSLLIRDARGNRMVDYEAPFVDTAAQLWTTPLAPGSYAIEVRGADGSRASETVRFEAGQDARVDILLQRPK